ncbi:MAG: leucine-rich repeat domain-containing protein [Clostridia bacterium]|nr:leucine-rich repeat domain-containing protein [Clostridia bacterium]
MIALTKINLSSVCVDFGENTAIGTDIVWSLESNPTIFLDDSGLMLSALKKGIFKITATLKTDSNVKKDLYVVVKDAADATWDIYNMDFTQYTDEYVKLGYDADKKVTYNGEIINDPNVAGAPEGWQSYFTRYSDNPADATLHLVEFSRSAFPYAATNGNPLSPEVSKGIVPFASPTVLGESNDRSEYKMAGYFVLNNDIVNDFADYSITTQGNYYSNSTNLESGFGVLGRVEFNDTGAPKFDATNGLSSIIVEFGMNHSPHYSASLAQNNGTVRSYYRNNDPDSNTASILVTNNNVTGSIIPWQYLNSLESCLANGCSDRESIGVDTTFTVKYSGNKATLSSPEDPENQIFSIDSESKTGGIAILQNFLRYGAGARYDNRTIVRTVKVSLNNDPTNPADYPAYEALTGYSFYPINMDSPAIPMYAGSYVNVIDLIITDNQGDKYLGSELTFVNKTGGNGIAIDNSIGRITAYAKGAYELEATHPNGTIITLYAVVKNKGDATWDIYNIDFTEHDDEYAKLGYVNNNVLTNNTPADIITYNGEPVSDTNPAPSAPKGWQSYYIHQKYPQNVLPTAVPDDVLAENPSMTLDTYHWLLMQENKVKYATKFPLSAYPYTTCDGEPLGYLNDGKYVNTINSGIMPFGNPADLGYNTLESAQNGYFVLNNSAVNAFANLTVTANANVFSSSSGPSEFAIAGRLAFDSNGDLKFDESNPITSLGVSYLGDNCGGSHSSNAPGEVGSTVRTNNSDTDGQRTQLEHNGESDTKFYWDYITGLGHCVDWNAPESRNGVNLSLSVKYEGNTATLSSPYDPAAETFVMESQKGKGGIAFVQTGLTDWVVGSWTNLKTVKVSLNNIDGECPRYTEFNYFITKDNAYLYTSAGQEISMEDMVVEINGNYYVGTDVTFTSSDSEKLVIDTTAKTIKTAEKGTYTLTATAGGNSLNILVAVKNVSEGYFVNNNYKVNVENGNIVSYTVVDSSVPLSKQIEFTDRIYNPNGTWINIYEVAASLSLNSGAYNTIVESVIFKGDNGKESYIEAIGANAFQNAINLQNIELPSRLKTIGANAFRNASALAEITIPAMVKTIGANAFTDCISLTDIYIYSPDVTITPGAIPLSTTVHCLEGSDVEKALKDAGYTTVPLNAALAAFATSERERIAKLDAKRIETVDTDVLWIGKTNDEKFGNYLSGFCLNNRDAGKIVITPVCDYLDELENYIKETDRKIRLIDSAFANQNDTRAVLSIEVKDGIEGGIFNNCFNVQEISLPDSFESISMNAFKGCTSLKKVNIPDNAIVMGKYAFTDCTNPELEIIISERSNLKYIGHNEMGTDPAEPAFSNCGATKIYLPITVEFVSAEAFKYSGFKDITFAGKDTAFANEKGVEFKEGEKLPQFFADGTIIRGLKGSKAEAYVNAYNAQVEYEALIFTTKDANGNELKDFFVEYADKVDENSEIKVELTDKGYYAATEYIGIGGKIIIPAIIDKAADGTLNAPVYAVSTSMFQSEKFTKPNIVRVLKLEISEGISLVEAKAFKDAVNLTEVKFPSSLKEIGNQAFQKSGIKGIVEIPKNVHTIGANAFAYCNGITDVYIYNPKATINGSAIPRAAVIHGVKGSTAEEYATKNKMTFVEISAPNLETAADVSDNGNYSFVVEGSKIVGYNRTDATKPYSRKVVIPAKIGDVTITEISENIFDIPAEKTSVYALVISEGISVIGKNAAYNCITLTHLELPKSITTIGDSAFEKTALIGDIVLSENVKSVGSRAFFGCRNINSITVLNRDCVLKSGCLPQGSDCTIIGYKNSTAEKYAKSAKLNFVCLDPETEDETDEDDTNNKGDLIDPDEDDDDGGIIRVIRQSDLTLVIVIAAAVLFMVLILGAAVVLVVFLKNRQDSDL